ncbi:MAG TPA: amidohydrolase family protein [Thermoanaerobaculia bacterium]|nr:amidohydrolase family protein [Thermoanaerobaculia bacterium]
MILHLLFLLRFLAPGPDAARETETFRLYKFQQPIGIERALRVRQPDGTTEIRVNFSFTDRNTTVPLSATLTLAKDGSVVRYQAWGSTSRYSQLDDRISVEDGTVSIERGGSAAKARAPDAFFVADGYSPVVVTQELWRYWSSHGKPAALTVFPSGSVAIERRGKDDVSDDEGKPATLERYSVGGLGWGRETFWVDRDGRLAALKAVDAEFDHFEATRTGYSAALPALVASAAADGLAALYEISKPALATPQGEESGAVAFTGATLIDAKGPAAVQDSVVVVEKGRITAAGTRKDVTIPKGARRIDLPGKAILPGLWDMHAHFEQVEWGPLYLAAGVTTVRDCGNELDFIRSVRDSVDSGKGLGPSILLACFVDGDGQASIGTTRLREESEIPSLIETFRGAGCSQVKIYSSLPPRLIAPLSKAAHEAGMTVTGHIPFGIGAVHAVEAGMDMINHMQYVVRALFPPSYDPDARLSQPVLFKARQEIDLSSASSKETLAFFQRRNVVVDPTMALAELNSHTPEEIARFEPGLAKVAEPLKPALQTFGASPEQAESSHKVWNLYLDVLRQLHRLGVPIVAGTDQAVPGHSLHREIEIYASAGFTPMEAIQAATIVPARVMKRDKESGSIEAGKAADLIVVDGDPLSDIRNLRRVSMVVKAGRVYDTSKLWRMVGFQP